MLGAPVEASTRQYAETASLDCLSYASKMNCDKAKGALDLYVNELEARPKTEARKKCLISVMMFKVHFIGIDFTGVDDKARSRFGEFQKACANF